MKSRIERSKKNIVFGLLGKIVQLFFKFLLRTTIIYGLGAVYLGLDGLFANIIMVLSIAELGIGNAICFALYRPFAEQNEKKIAAYMNLYKKIFAILGIVILILGLILIPALGNIVNFDKAVAVNYYGIYILFLFNTVVTYWFASYKQVLFIADQKAYVVDNIKNSVYMVTVIMQILGLILFRSYYSYLVLMILGNVATNIAISAFADREYSFIKKYKEERLEGEDKADLKKNVFALALTKVSSVIYTSSDNIVISIFISTVTVGYYSNYSYIVSAVTGIISIIFSGLLSSVGNANIGESAKKMETIFKRMLFVNFWIYGVIFTCLMQLFQDFISLWAGKEYLLGNTVVYFIGLLFLIPGLNHTCTIYKDACGLFWQTRYRTIATATINIIISVILVGKIGLIGVFLGTIVSYFLTTFLKDPIIIYKEVLMTTPKKFYLWYASSFIIINFVNGLIGLCLKNLLADTYIMLSIKAIVCFTIVNIIYFLLCRKTEEFQYFKELLKNEITKRK